MDINLPLRKHMYIQPWPISYWKRASCCRVLNIHCCARAVSMLCAVDVVCIVRHWWAFSNGRKCWTISKIAGCCREMHLEYISGISMLIQFGLEGRSSAETVNGLLGKRHLHRHCHRHLVAAHPLPLTEPTKIFIVASKLSSFQLKLCHCQYLLEKWTLFNLLCKYSTMYFVWWSFIFVRLSSGSGCFRCISLWMAFYSENDSVFFSFFFVRKFKWIAVVLLATNVRRIISQNEFSCNRNAELQGNPLTETWDFSMSFLLFDSAKFTHFWLNICSFFWIYFC